MSSIRLGAYAFAVTDGRVLLAQISTNDATLPAGHWTLPGGGLEWGEHPEAGMHRELYEETGLEGEIVRVLGVDSKVVDNQVQSVRIVYEVNCEGEPQVMEVDGTVSDSRWIPLSELAAHPIVSLVEFALDQAGISRD